MTYLERNDGHRVEIDESTFVLKRHTADLWAITLEAPDGEVIKIQNDGHEFLTEEELNSIQEEYMPPWSVFARNLDVGESVAFKKED